MPDAFGFGAAGQGVGSFLEGLLRGKADRAARESQTRQERLGRVGTVLSLATDLMRQAEAKDLVPEEKNRLYQQGRNLWEGAVELFGTVDAKQEARKKRNPVVAALSALNPFAGRGDKGEDAFQSQFTQLLSKAGPSGSQPVTGVTIPDLGSTAGGVLASSSGMGGPPEAKPSEAAPQLGQPTTPTPQYFRDPRKEISEAVSTLDEMFGYIASTERKETSDEAMADPKFRQLYLKAHQYVAAGILPGENLQAIMQASFPDLRPGYRPPTKAKPGENLGRQAEKAVIVYGALPLAEMPEDARSAVEGYKQWIAMSKGPGTPLSPKEQAFQDVWTALRKPIGSRTPEEKGTISAYTSIQGIERGPQREDRNVYTFSEAYNQAAGRTEVYKRNQRTGAMETTGIPADRNINWRNWITKSQVLHPDPRFSQHGLTVPSEKIDPKRIILDAQLGNLSVEDLERIKQTLPPEDQKVIDDYIKANRPAQPAQSRGPAASSIPQNPYRNSENPLGLDLTRPENPPPSPWRRKNP